MVSYLPAMGGVEADGHSVRIMREKITREALRIANLSWMPLDTAEKRSNRFLRHCQTALREGPWTFTASDSRGPRTNKVGVCNGSYELPRYKSDVDSLESSFGGKSSHRNSCDSGWSIV